MPRSHIIAFLFFLITSQIFLPAIGREYLYPFFDWKLFATSPVRWSNYDLELVSTSDQSKHFYTDLPRRYDTWAIVQNLGYILNNGMDSTHQVSLIKNTFAQNGWIPIRLVKIQKKLPEYLMLKKSEKSEFVSVIYEFER